MSAPFWSPPPERYPGRRPEKADVLVERNRIASGGSGGNAGFLLAGVASSYAEVVVFVGQAYALQLIPAIEIQPTRAHMLATAPESKRVTDLPVYSLYICAGFTGHGTGFAFSTAKRVVELI